MKSKIVNMGILLVPLVKNKFNYFTEGDKQFNIKAEIFTKFVSGTRSDEEAAAEIASKLDLQKALGLSATAIDNNISYLKNKGLLERIGPDRGGEWQINYITPGG